MLVLLLPPILLAIAALTILAIVQATSQERTARFAEINRTTQAEAMNVEAQVARNLATARQLATTMAGYTGGDRQQAIAIVRETIARNQQLVGAWAGFEPNVFDGADSKHRGEPGSDGKGQFGPFWSRRDDKLALEVVAGGSFGTGEYWTVPATPAATR